MECNYFHNTPVSDSNCKGVLGVSSYTLKRWLKEHPIKSSRGVDIQTPQMAVLKHPIFNGVPDVTSLHHCLQNYLNIVLS